MEQKPIILSVKDLRVNFSTDHGYVQAVRGVSFDLYKGETLCIVGESGSGKSVTSKTIMGILAANGRIVDGSIMYEGEDLTKVSEDEFHRIRGHKIGMIFQDPLSSLNPIMRIGKQITEAMLVNASRTKKMYEELVAEELVAYKNAQTELRSGLDQYKEQVKFLKSEKKKELSKAKNYASNEIESRLYTLKQVHGANVFKIHDDANAAIADIERLYGSGTISLEELQARIKEINDNVKVLVAEENKEYASKKAEVKLEIAHLKEEAKARKEQVLVEYTRKINEAKQKSKDSKAALKAKYRPIIKETKEAFKIKSKEAKAEVAKYKKSLKIEHLTKRAEIIAEAKANNYRSSYVKELIKQENYRYKSSLRITKAEAKARALKIMKEVGISEPEKRFRQYPFEFSGGMRQRIVIAIALTADPDILICDEPTTALDVTIQAQILELINRLKKERNLSCIFITHDLGVVANMADRVAVMYAGKIVEYGTEEEIFYDPRHPYTWALLASIPDIDSNEKLEAIPGTPPNMIYPPVGDAFALRSKYAMAIDFKKEPPLFKVSETHYAATWLLDPRAPKVEMPKIVKTRIENSLKAAKKGGK